MRREWIEIVNACLTSVEIPGLPPCGGSGLKFTFPADVPGDEETSPSMRREWIEIGFVWCPNHSDQSSPSMRREWIEMIFERTG